MARILIVGSDAIGNNMAGPGIRSYEIAKVLSKNHDVVIAVQSVDNVKPFGPEIILKEHDLLAQYIPKSDIIMVQGFLMEQYPILRNIHVPLIVDLYDPFIFEGLQLDKNLPMTERLKRHNFNLKMFADQLIMGDFFVTANEEQRDYWIGMLAVYNRINPWTYEGDKTLYNLIDVVPFGISDEKPVHKKRVLKGVHPGIGVNDKIILWGGGIWNWFDPLSLVKAMKIIAAERDDIKLFFMGTKRPDAPPDIAEESSHFRKMESDAKKFCEQEKLLDKFVFFNDWVPFFDRENYLLESDIGISLHLKTIEVEFANRTRILDYIWAKLPIITTKGDPLSKMVGEKSLGITVNPQNVTELKNAIYTLLDNKDKREEMKNNQAMIAQEFLWSKVTLPLQKFCENPKFADDKPAKKSEELSKTHEVLQTKSEDRQKVLQTLQDEFARTTNEIGIIMDDYYRINKEFVNKISILEKNLKNAQTAAKVLEYIVPLRMLKRIKTTVLQILSKKTGLSDKEILGEIYGNTTVRQNFLCKDDRLCGISIQFATFNRYNDKEVIFSLHDSANPRSKIVESKVIASELVDNQYYYFQFKPIVNTHSRNLFFQISSPDSFKGNAVTIWTNPLNNNPENKLIFDNRESSGQIYFKLYFES